jgi:hypothetical protein
MYIAFESGRTAKDPSIDWYQGEIWFFDNCVIPLAQRIKDCGMFGVQGDDSLRNAFSNKKEWTVKGADIVTDLIAKIKQKKETASLIAKQEEEKTEEQKKQEIEAGKKESKDKQLIEWNVDLFKRMLRQILAKRIASGLQSKEQVLNMAHSLKEGSTVRDSIVRIIDFPKFDKKASKLKVDPETVELSKAVEDQLRDFISFIASMYRDHEFHNFKHASNVSMAANKFMQRIVDGTLAKQVAEPLTQFGVMLSALLHDVDHSGVSNAQLVEEKARLAALYHNKSVAEQNSVDMSWSVLMSAEYKDLQNAIYCDESEFARFRGIVVNTIMATDLFDEELIADRHQRWLEAFSPDYRDASLSEQEHLNLKATIVMENVMQASDISHTMQHFHSYRGWSERFFIEKMTGFDNGRLVEDPSKTWYEGEIKFFDQYVIPLAKKLKESGMFGIAGDDALSCAQANRKEWVVRGVEIVGDLKKKYNEKNGSLRE